MARLFGWLTIHQDFWGKKHIYMPARRWTKMIEFCIKIVHGEFFGNFYIGPVNNSTGTIPDWVKDWFSSLLEITATPTDFGRP